MQQEVTGLDEFDELLVATINEVLMDSLGPRNADIILRYLEQKSCPLPEVPRRLEVFSAELRVLLGFGRGQILGAASILEETIAIVMCSKSRIKFQEKPPIAFPQYITRLRAAFTEKKSKKKRGFSKKRATRRQPRSPRPSAAAQKKR